MLENAGLGFYGKYLIQYYVARNGREIDLSSTASKIGYIIWCYLHMGLSDWIHYLVPPCFYSNDWPEDSVWFCWAVHVAVTVCILRIVWKVIKFIKNGGFKKLLETDYTFDTSKLIGVIKLGNYYRTKSPEWFKKVAADRMYKEYFKSVSNICTEIWTTYEHKEKYAIIIHEDENNCVMSFCDKGETFYTVHFKIGDVITFGVKDKENDPVIVSAFNKLRTQVDILYSVYEDRKSMIDK